MIRSMKRHLQAVPQRRIEVPGGVSPSGTGFRDFMSHVDALAAQCGVHPSVILAQMVERSSAPVEWKLEKLKRLGIQPSAELLSWKRRAHVMYSGLLSLSGYIVSRAAQQPQAFSGMLEP